MCANDARRRGARRALLTEVLAASDVVALQEVHGGTGALCVLFPELESQFFVYATACDARGAGGTALLIRRSWLPAGAVLTERVLVRGRVLAVRAAVGDSFLDLWAVHNFDLGSGGLDRALGVLSAQLRAARARPCSHEVLIMGDFNFYAPGESPNLIAEGGSHAAASRAAGADTCLELAGGQKPGQRRWQELLSSLADVGPEGDTHCNEAGRTTSRLDRVFSSVPRWWLLQRRLVGKVWRCPVALSTAGVSDHAPLWVSSAPAPRHSSRPTVPPHIFRHALFRKLLPQYLVEVDDPLLPAPMRYERFVSTLLAVGARVRLAIAAAPVATEKAHAIAQLSLVARAASRRDGVQARRLCELSPFFAERLTVDAAGCASLVNPVGFEDEFAEAFRNRALARLASRRAVAAPGGPPAREDGPLLRKAAAWSRSQPRVVVEALLDADGHEHTSLEGRAAALGAYWGAVFLPKPSDAAAREELLAHTVPLGPLAYAIPSRQSLLDAARWARNSAPGEDGLPAEAWRGGGAAAADVLHDVALWLAAGKPFHGQFQNSVAICIPKKPPPTAKRLTAKVSEVRLLSLKTVGNKLCCAALARRLRSAIAAGAAWPQRGFVAGRQLALNVVQMQAEAVVASARARPDSDELVRGWAAALACRSSSSVAPSLPDLGPQPALLLLDLQAAFPSVGWPWLWAVLARLGLSSGVRRFISQIYCGGAALQCAGGAAEHSFDIRSGVVQGCPLSGAMFVLLLDPLIRRLGGQIRGRGCVNACADDLAVVAADVAQLDAVGESMALLSRAAALRLNLAKCQLVPLAAAFSEELRRFVVARLRRDAPFWSSVPVVPCAVFLGILLGPAVSHDMAWAGPLARARAVAQRILSMGLSPALSSALIRSRAVAVLGYVAQLVPAPRALRAQDGAWLNAVLRCPGRVVGADFLPAARDLFGVMPPDASLMSSAALARAAVATLADSSRYAAMLRRRVGDDARLAGLASPCCWPPFWASAPLATVLADVAVGRPPYGVAPRSPAVAAALAVRAVAPVAGETRQPGLQRTLYAALARREECSEPIEMLLLRRARRLDPQAFSELPLPLDLVGRSRSVSRLCGAAAWRTWLNGWPTHRRTHLDGADPGCLFECGEAAACDCLRHYASCPVLNAVLADVWRAPPSRISALGLRAGAFEVAASAYAIYTALNAKRRRGVPAPPLLDLARAARTQFLPRRRAGGVPLSVRPQRV